jgi:hypothetical protein
LKPLIDFAQAIGFMGPPDRWEEARRTVAATRAEAAAAAAAGSGQGVKPGEILIDAKISKDASGKTAAGTNANATASKTDKKDETKQDDKTKKKK